MSFKTIADNRTTLFDYRFWHAPDHTRIVFDTAKGLDYKLEKQDRKIILSIKNPKLLTRTYQNLFWKDSRIVRTSIKRIDNHVQIIFWTKHIYYVKSFTLKPNSKYPHYRLVIDITDKIKKDKPITSKKAQQKVIIIDAGHGGEDPGALGKHSQEKNIVLSIAKKLQSIIHKNSAFKTVLTRKGDYFVGLGKRPRIAQNNNAIAFISIHADSALRQSAKGSSVYVLSNKGGTTKLAKKLEKSENATDIFGNQDIAQDKALNTIMRDLARKNRKVESVKLATSILSQLKKIDKLHKEQPQKANFVVLKTPAIPSVLVETAFLSNPEEEQRLLKYSEQVKIAKAIYLGIANYLKN